MPSTRFRAFISYSQRDKTIARRLHKALETYRVPSGVSGAFDAKTRRIGRLFRDDDEMGASADLGATLRGALDDTDALIVICSRRSAKSQWVNQEIAYFKRSGRAARIFAVIIDGAPDATKESEHCFAPALRFEVDADGAVTNRPSEPLGLDMRAQSFDRLVVRLIAGLLSVPFDDLWQRDQRRKRRNRMVLAASGVAAAAALSVGGFLWQRDLATARVQQIERALAEARTDAGEGRLGQALARLRPYLAGSDATLVEPTLRTILGWATPVAAQMSSAGAPRLLAYRGSVLFVDADGRVQELPDVGIAPERVLLTRDLQRLVVVGERRTIVLNAVTGAVLARTENNGTAWHSFAFETPEGRLVVLGTRPGSTNGAITHAVLTVSADGATVSATPLTAMVDLRSVWLGGGCDALLIGGRDEPVQAWPLTANDTLVEETYPNTNARQVVEATLVWSASEGGTPDADSPFSSEVGLFELQNQNPFTEIGCESVAADSAAADLDPRIAEVVNIGASGAGSAAFTALPELPMLYRPMQGSEIEGFWAGEIDQVHRVTGRGFFRSLPVPRGIAPETSAHDAVGGLHLAFLEDRANAGTRWVICGRGDECVTSAAMHNEARSYELVRSPQGSYLLIAQAGTLIDLARLRTATDEAGLPTGPGTAFDFEPDRDQLTIIDGGELIAYRPDENGLWSRAEEIAGVSLRESETGFAGLVALGDGAYLIVRQDGGAIRVGQSGQVIWQMTYAGLGEISGVRYSANRHYAALVGHTGLRVIDVQTGLAMSGVLKPAGWSASDAADCLFGIHVSDDGALRAICMSYSDENPRTAQWSPRVFEGDLAARIDAMLCDADDGLTAQAALTQCLGRDRR